MGGVMTRDDIIRMSQEAGFEIEKTLYGPVPCVDGRGIDDRLERFAALVAEREREAYESSLSFNSRGTSRSRTATIS